MTRSFDAVIIGMGQAGEMIARDLRKVAVSFWM
jgi:pyruvate/2-oxoglutarate dehydrogenase complex dihydrolipoamide dehydrogenase (E3) component